MRCSLSRQVLAPGRGSYRFELPPREQDTLPEGIRMLSRRDQSGATLDAAMVRSYEERRRCPGLNQSRSGRAVARESARPCGGR